MDKALEIAAVDAAVALTGEGPPVHPAHTRGVCLNCGAGLQGRFCHVCGQSADDHHRSILHLMWEAVEGLTHLDGRLAKTLPALLIWPGRLARDQIEGRRTRHVPPFRLFLISLLLFMLAVETVVHHEGRGPPARPRPGAATQGAATQGAATQGAATQGVTIKVVRLHPKPGQAPAVIPLQTIDTVDVSKDPDFVKLWLVPHLRGAVHNPAFFLTIVFDWAHRLAVLMLPILAAELTLFYVYKHSFYIYDHLVVAMQYLSFCFLLWAVVWLIPEPVRDWVMLPAMVWTPVNLYLLLRGAYGSSRIGAAVKALVLWVSTLTLFMALLIGLLALALNQV